MREHSGNGRKSLSGKEFHASVPSVTSVTTISTHIDGQRSRPTLRVGGVCVFGSGNGNRGNRALCAASHGVVAVALDWALRLRGPPDRRLGDLVATSVSV